MFFLCIKKLLVIMCLVNVLGAFPKNLAWNGGPVHLNCEHVSDFWTTSRQHVYENVIATKAISYMDEIYVITPRMKHGVLATVWLIVREQRGVELQPFPQLQAHNLGNCDVIQNAVDFYLDHLGNFWILDSGIIDTLESPRCTCPPKIVVINILLEKITKRVVLASIAEPNSLLQNIAIEHGFGRKTYVYITDASRGAVLVHETSSGSEWAVTACAPSAGLQSALVKRRPKRAVLILVRLHQQGLIEMDTAALRRKSSLAPFRIFGDHTKPVILLGSNGYHIYLRHIECSDVMSWDSKKAYNVSQLVNIHSAGPRLMPISVAPYSLKPILLVLDSNYVDTVHSKGATYHKITFISQK